MRDFSTEPLLAPALRAKPSLRWPQDGNAGARGTLMGTGLSPGAVAPALVWQQGWDLRGRESPQCGTGAESSECSDLFMFCIVFKYFFYLFLFFDVQVLCLVIVIKKHSPPPDHQWPFGHAIRTRHVPPPSRGLCPEPSPSRSCRRVPPHPIKKQNETTNKRTKIT